MKLPAVPGDPIPDDGCDDNGSGGEAVLGESAAAAAVEDPSLAMGNGMGAG